MASRGTRRVAFVAPVRTGDAKADRAQNETSARVNQLLRNTFTQAVPLEVDLIEGLNKIGHGIGSPVAHFSHAALPDATATLSSAQADNPFPARQVWVQMAGAATCRALLFLFPVVG